MPLFFALVLLLSPIPSFAGAIIWDGGNGDWFGPFVGTLPGNPIPFPTPTTNWDCQFCYPGSGDTVNIGTLYGSPIGAVTGTATLTTSTTVAGVSLGNGASGGLQISSGGNLTATDGIVLGAIGPTSGTLTISSGGVMNTGFGWLGGVTGSSGSATVSGFGSQLNVSGQFLVATMAREPSRFRAEAKLHLTTPASVTLAGHQGKQPFPVQARNGVIQAS